jgi:iron complex transport system substrate-binding protein
MENGIPGRMRSGMPFLRSTEWRWTRAVATFGALAMAFACRPAPEPVKREATAEPPMRIVSLAPSVTEVLFALDLGDRVVGVTRYCDNPPEARRLPRVGGYLDLSYEAVLGLDPDLVIGIQDHREAFERLTQLGVATLRVDQHDVEGILASIERIAGACGVPERGRRLVAGIEDRLALVADRTRGLPRPRALVVVGRDAGTGELRSVWVAGRSTFYDDVLRLAGGVNAAGPSAAAYPELSREGLLHIDPDIIVDLLADLEQRDLDAETALADWSGLSILRAVRSRRLHVLEHEYAVIPGPRVAELVESFARLLHPEVDL